MALLCFSFLEEAQSAPPVVVVQSAPQLGVLRALRASVLPVFRLVVPVGFPVGYLVVSQVVEFSVARALGIVLGLLVPPSASS